MAQVSHASHLSQPSLPHCHLVIPETEALPTKNATWAQGQAGWLSRAGIRGLYERPPLAHMLSQREHEDAFLHSRITLSLYV